MRASCFFIAKKLCAYSVRKLNSIGFRPVPYKYFVTALVILLGHLNCHFRIIQDLFGVFVIGIAVNNPNIDLDLIFQPGVDQIIFEFNIHPCRNRCGCVTVNNILNKDKELIRVKP